MISQRAWLIGGVGFCFYLIAIVNTLPSFYYALTWLAVGVLASSLGIALLSLIGLRCAWQAPRAVVSRALDDSLATYTAVGPVVELQLANAGTLNKTGIVVEVDLARLEDGAPNPKPRRAVLTERFLVEALPSGQSLRTQLPLLNLPRGRYRVLEMRLYGSDVLGLFRTQKRVPPGLHLDEAGVVVVESNLENNAAQNHKSKLDKTETESIAQQITQNSSAPEEATIVVGPATLPLGETLLQQLASARGEGGISSTSLQGQSDEMRGTRLYAPGDDLRHVHWRSTARRGQLVVKEFHHTLQNRVLVVWDGTQETNWGERRGDFNTLEWGLCLAASLCRSFLERHQPCVLLRLDSRPMRIGLEESTPRLPNASLSNAGLNMSQVSETLSSARADRSTTLSAAMSATMPFLKSGRSAHSNESPSEIFLISASLAPDVVDAVKQWRATGAQVSVALVNGAAFLTPSRKPPLQSLAAPVSSSPVKESSHTTSPNADHSIAVTRENFQTQLQRLRAVGAHTIGVEPQAGTPAETALMAAFHRLMQKDNAAHFVATTDTAVTAMTNNRESVAV